MSESTKTPNRKPEEITEDAVGRILEQLGKIPHYRYVATVAEKQHIVSSLRSAIEEVAQRIKTPREAFSLSAALAPEEAAMRSNFGPGVNTIYNRSPNGTPEKFGEKAELAGEPISSQEKWKKAKAQATEQGEEPS